MSKQGIFNDLVIGGRPVRIDNHRFTAEDQGTGSGPWPMAQLVITTMNSVYVVLVEGGAWQTVFTLSHTTNETAQRWLDDRVVVQDHSAVQDLITSVLYGDLPIRALAYLDAMIGHQYVLTFNDGAGMYGSEAKETGSWRITEIQSIELQRA